MYQKHLSILLVDDDKDDIDLLTDAIILLNPAVDITAFNDGQAAIDYLAGIKDSQYPHLIVLDFNMPLLNGLQVLEKIVAYRRLPSIPTVMLSTAGSSEYSSLCLSAGARNFFKKPNDVSELNKLAEELIDLCLVCSPR